MNVKKAIDKLAEWNNAGEKLKQHVPNNDEVLHSWLTQLDKFSQDLPLLRQLSSDALKVINPCRTVCTKLCLVPKSNSTKKGSSRTRNRVAPTGVVNCNAS